MPLGHSATQWLLWGVKELHVAIRRRISSSCCYIVSTDFPKDYFTFFVVKQHKRIVFEPT